MATASYGDAFRNGLGWLGRFDESLLIRVRRRHTPLASRVMTLLTRAGEPGSWVVHCLLLAVAAGPGGYRLPVLLAAGVLVATATSQLLKRTFRRRRPNDGIAGFSALLEDPDAFSFPSGHTAVAFGAATALASGNPALAGAELALAIAIGCSRVYLGAHYPADVVAGAIVGIASGAAAAAACAPLF